MPHPPPPAFVSTGDAELDRALQLGIGAHSQPDEAVTYAQFMTKLNRVVELADSTKLAGWQGQLADARKSTRKIHPHERSLRHLRRNGVSERENTDGV